MSHSRTAVRRPEIADPPRVPLATLVAIGETETESRLARVCLKQVDNTTTIRHMRHVGSH